MIMAIADLAQMPGTRSRNEPKILSLEPGSVLRCVALIRNRYSQNGVILNPQHVSEIFCGDFKAMNPDAVTGSRK